MVHYRNMDAYRVEAFWADPSFAKLLGIIRENLNDNALVNCDESLQAQDEEPERISGTNRGDSCQQRKEAFKTAEKINSLSNVFHDAIVDESKRALLIDKLQVAMQSLEGDCDPHIRDSMDIARKFIEAKKFDICNILGTSLEFSRIIRELLLPSSISSHECYGNVRRPASVVERLTSLDGMIAEGSASCSRYSARAKTCMRSGDYVQALNDFAEVVVRTNFEYWYQIEECACHFKLGQFSAARDILERWIIRQQNGFTSVLNFEFLEGLPVAKSLE